MRCFTEEDLEKAKFYFEKAGLPAQWVERPHQGRTLHVNDAVGAPLEFCATMTMKPRLIVSFKHHHGAVPQRLDHFQLLVPDVQRQLEFYMAMGFRLSEYIATDGTDEPMFVFLQRKGNPHDIVFAPGAGTAAASCRIRHPGILSCSSMSAILPRIWALPRTSNTVPAGTARATRYSSICAIPTAIASSSSIRIINAWISRMSRCAGTLPMPASGAGSYRRANAGSPRPAGSPASSRTSRRAKAIR